MEKQYDGHFDNWVEEENKKHITQTLDKQKLLKWLEILAKTNALSQAFYGIDATIKEINKGTFDIS